MTSELAFECLFVSRDPVIYRTVTKLLDDFSINSDHCLTASNAKERWAKGSHDLVVIDWESDAASFGLLNEICGPQAKLRPTIMTISSETYPPPGVHVHLRKPVTSESGMSSFRTAYSRMLLDYRSRARYPLMIPHVATDEKHRSISVTIIDVSAGGVGIESRHKFDIGDVLSFAFLLPGAKTQLSFQARVLWTRDYGVAGCEFRRISPADLELLEGWLKQKICVKKPLIPA